MMGIPARVVGILVVVAALAAAIWLGWGAIRFWTFSPQDIGRLLGPVMLTALLLERSLEVLLTPWRAGGADDLAEDAVALRAYKAKTRQIAFLMGLSIGLVLSVAGIRAIAPFLDPEASAKLPAYQQSVILMLDVLLTGAVLAGGADWLHQFVTVFTTYFDKAKA